MSIKGVCVCWRVTFDLLDRKNILVIYKTNILIQC